MVSSWTSRSQTIPKRWRRPVYPFLKGSHFHGQSTGAPMVPRYPTNSRPDHKGLWTMDHSCSLNKVLLNPYFFIGGTLPWRYVDDRHEIVLFHHPKKVTGSQNCQVKVCISKQVDSSIARKGSFEILFRTIPRHSVKLAEVRCLGYDFGAYRHLLTRYEWMPTK